MENPEVIGWGITAIVGLVGGGFLLRVQSKITEFEKDADNKYVNKDVCKILNENICQDVKEIKKDVKDLLRMNGNKRND